MWLPGEKKKKATCSHHAVYVNFDFGALYQVSSFDYEELRLRNIQDNETFLSSLGIAMVSFSF